MNPEDLKYHKEHTWARIEGKRARVGITDYAQVALGDIVYVDLPKEGASVEAGAEMSEIESTKAASAVISPVSGTIVEVNSELDDAPEVINEDPYGKGWIAVVELSGEADLDALLDASEYEKHIEEAGR